MPEETSVASPEDVPDEPPVAPRPPHRRRRRVTLIVGAVVAAMAVAVAVIALTASPANPYAAPHSVCALVSPATVAKYVPGRPRIKGAEDSCTWNVKASDGLAIFVSVLDSAAQARTGFTQLIQQNRKGGTYQGSTTTVTGTRAVTGLGDQATVLYQFSTAKKNPGKRARAACLFIRSRNAIIQVLLGIQLPGAADRPGAAFLPGTIAIAREVMAAMPLLGPDSPGVGVHISLDVSHPVGDLVILGEPGRGDQHWGIAE